MTGRPSGAFHQLGSALVRFYNDSQLGIDASIQSTSALSVRLNALDEGSADVAITRADIAYAAYVRGTQFTPRPHAGLRGIAVTFASTLHVMVRKDTAIETLHDLRSKRIGYTSPPSEVKPTVRLLDLVSSSGAFGPGDLNSVGMNLDALIAALAAGTLDGGFMMSSDPDEVFSRLKDVSGFRLLEVPPDAATKIRAQYPFFKPVEIRAGTYPGQPQAVRTVGVDNLLVCREELDEELVYKLTKGLFEVLPEVAKTLEVAAQIDPDLAAATPIPLHAGAARYYRERELLK